MVYKPQGERLDNLNAMVRGYLLVFLLTIPGFSHEEVNRCSQLGDNALGVSERDQFIAAMDPGGYDCSFEALAKLIMKSSKDAQGIPYELDLKGRPFEMDIEPDSECDNAYVIRSALLIWKKMPGLKPWDRFGCNLHRKANKCKAFCVYEEKTKTF
ncbi:unnamed protein product [Strongylus vulgaris]|uniref:Uncharacterized protein n=1 Tax=Strongylus vulgaris TaxID=40348 RepID=A0A3P7JR30_STRVU|nr:unnamed protein product [Strongylus vulgaris]